MNRTCLEYPAFLARKAQLDSDDGFAPIFMPSFLFDFQASLVDWAVRKGRAAIFADCGLGKTPMQLVWAQNVVQHTNRPVLIVAPLAVSSQTVGEAGKFGIEAVHRKDGTSSGSNIIVTNYESLHKFDPADFAGAVCDESAILKSFDGVRRKEITEFMRKMRYRLLCTATPSPNEYPELGTSSEALGYLGHMDMLTQFFKNDQGNSIKPFVVRHSGKNFRQLDEAAKWRFKGHAEAPFWRWVSSWTRALRKPSDLGFADDRFVLPPLEEHLHLVESKSAPDGFLFSLPAVGLTEQRAERRRSISERCEKAASLAAGGDQCAIWCHLNDEGDELECAIPGAVQVSGSDSDDAKEEKFLSFVSGESRVLVTKEKIAGWGLNFQHCATTISFPTHSFEGYYQSVRRFWRFGQTRPVQSHIVASEGEKNVLANLRRKSAAADRMFAALVEHMRDELNIRRAAVFEVEEKIPLWL